MLVFALFSAKSSPVTLRRSQAHDTAVQAITWSHNNEFMVTGDKVRAPPRRGDTSAMAVTRGTAGRRARSSTG